MIDPDCPLCCVTASLVSWDHVHRARVSQMARVYTMPVTATNFRSIGLPGWLAYVVTTVELIGGGFLVVGLAPRYVGLLLVPLIVGTVITVTP